jgi:predicted nucleic acid-binding protein
MSPRRRAALDLPPTLFVDSSAWYALLDKADRYHSRAAEIADALSRSRTRLYTSNVMRIEAHALVLNRLGHAAADRFLASLNRFPLTIEQVTPDDEEEALALLRKYHDKDFTLADATSFVVMERLGITTAWSFDDDFPQYGWRVL